MRTLDDHEASEAARALRLAYLLADPVELIHHLEAVLASRSNRPGLSITRISGKPPEAVIPPVTGSAQA
jgi:hypothetical protein